VCGPETQRRCTGQTSHCNDVVFCTPCWYTPGPTGDTGITQVLCNSVAMVAATPMHGEARLSGDGEQPVEGRSGVTSGSSTVLLCNGDGHQRCAGAAQTAHTVWSVRIDLLIAQMVSFELVVAGDDGDGHGGTVAVGQRCVRRYGLVAGGLAVVCPGCRRRWDGW